MPSTLVSYSSRVYSELFLTFVEKSWDGKYALVWVPQEADPEANTQLQVVYFGGGPRKHWMESMDVRWEGKDARIAHVNKQVTAMGY